MTSNPAAVSDPAGEEARGSVLVEGTSPKGCRHGRKDLRQLAYTVISLPQVQHRVAGQMMLQANQQQFGQSVVWLEIGKCILDHFLLSLPVSGHKAGPAVTRVEKHRGMMCGIQGCRLVEVFEEAH
eukprot:1159122-Pelagomonas_calceolata.AAC.10